MKTPDTEIWRSFEVHSQVLNNGLKVLLVENPVIPAIAINATVLAGARHEPEDKRGWRSWQAIFWMREQKLAHL